MVAAANKGIDWDEMEPDWRAGIKTKKQLAIEYNVSRAAIDKHWHKLGIERDLAARIQSAAKAKVTRATVTRGVTLGTKVTEQEVVEANATLVADKLIAHRTDIPQKRALVGKLFSEIEGLTDGPELIDQLALALQQDDQDKLADLARKVASLPARIKGVAELVGAYKALIGLEREAFGIGAGTTPGEEFTEIVRRIVNP